MTSTKRRKKRSTGYFVEINEMRMDPGRQKWSVRNTLCLSVKCLFSCFPDSLMALVCGFAQLSFPVLIVTVEIGINLSFSQLCDMFLRQFF